jgi:ParB family chromosome partitioning protein
MNYAVTPDNALISVPTYDRMCAAIVECERVDEAKDIADKARALEIYAHQAKNIEAEHRAINIRIRAERRTGELLESEERTPPTERHISSRDGTKSPSPFAETLARIGLSKQDASRFQRLAAIPAPEFEAALEKEERPTTRGLIDKPAHRTNFTGENEWFTPPPVLELARAVMGGIDLDPASSAQAQATVQAERYFSADDDGLAQEWSGRVWLNPPYAQPLLSEFVAKLIAEVRSARVAQAILLTHNYTDTAWSQAAMEAADAIGFTRGRIHFISKAGEMAQPTQGQMVCYFGPFIGRFAEVFHATATILTPLRGPYG